VLLAYLLAVALAGVFVVSAVAKAADLPATARAFRALGLPAPYPLARGATAAELAAAALLLAVPRAGGVVALVLLTTFSAVLADALRRGVDATCACFGIASEGPISGRQLVRNAVLALGALGAALWGPAAVWAWAG
jgi:uncharacterized membrane protein YphA (DoxX/SURF4 family)